MTPLNTNDHTERGGVLLENSIRRRGAFRGIGAAGKGVETPVVKAGNLTLQKARNAGIKEIVMVHTTGDQLVVTVRDDLDPDSPEAAMLGIEDNQIANISYAPNPQVLAMLSQGQNALLSGLLEKDSGANGMLVDLVKQAGVFGEPPKLDQLADQFGEPQAEDFWPVIKVKVSPEVKSKFDDFMANQPGNSESEKFEALLSYAEA